jgi:two-component system chemotaxis response regulator CheY
MYNEPLKYLVPQTSNFKSELHGATILLVDDDPDIRSLTRTFLEHEGYRVHSCGDPERASQIFRSSLENSASIDLLITDFYMPERSGMELAQELKALRRELPVLLISGGLLRIEQLEHLRTEGWYFLGKPFALPGLLTTVHRILGNSEATV